MVLLVLLLRPRLPATTFHSNPIRLLRSRLAAYRVQEAEFNLGGRITDCRIAVVGGERRPIYSSPYSTSLEATEYLVVLRTCGPEIKNRGLA